jgi:hypothetical protein
MFLLSLNNDLAALKVAVKEGIKLELGREEREYFVGIGMGRILLNALVHCTVSSNLSRI